MSTKIQQQLAVVLLEETQRICAVFDAPPDFRTCPGGINGGRVKIRHAVLSLSRKNSSGTIGLWAPLG
jgi:hypothetical protein